MSDDRTDNMPDDTGSKQVLTRFQPGQSGNPKGRPRGARNQLGEAFLEDLLEDWQAHGRKAIETVRQTKPDQYLRVIASILPRELNVRVNELDEMTDEQLAVQLQAMLRQIAAAGVELFGDQPPTPRGVTVQ